MDYKRIAVFLSRCTSRGFRRSLQINPYATLIKCGFDPGEAHRLTGSLGTSASEKGKVSLVFQKIAYTFDYTSVPDDWDTGP
jgi:hypothetical protein